LEKGIPARLSPAEGRKFGLLVGGAFLGLAWLSHWRGHTIPPWVMGPLGAALVLGGLLVPARLGGIHRAWMRFALLISRVTTPLFMGVVYFLVLTPTGWLIRLFGRNPLRHGSGGAPLWVSRKSEGGVKSSMSRQF
jgi:saxitoxin biosynthesis operon SxtJ-like protein